MEGYKNTLHAWRRVVLLSSIYVPLTPLGVKKWGGGDMTPSSYGCAAPDG